MLSFDQCVEKIKDEKRVLLLGTPKYKRSCDDYDNSRDETLVQCMGLDLPLLIYNGAPVTLIELGRALILDYAVKTPPITDVMMIDDDMGWNPDDLIRLWASDKGLVAGVGRRKGTLGSDNPGGYATLFLTAEGGERKAHMLPKELRFPVDTEDGMMEVEGVGAAFLRIRVEAIRRMVAHYPELIGRVAMTTPTGAVERMLLPLLFKTDIFGGDYQTEDYSFCNRWRAMGEKVWIDPTIKLRHWGEHCWEGSLMEGFRRKPVEKTDVAASDLPAA